MPRKPLGTYVRTLADWAYPFSVTAGAPAPKLEGDATSWTAVALYNNAPQGQLLVLDGIDVSPNGDDWYATHTQGVDGAPMNGFSGLPLGTPIYSGQPVQFGAIYGYNGVNAPLIASNANQALGPMAGSLDTVVMGSGNPPAAPMISIRARGPLAVLKPGYAYNVVFIPLSALQATVNFYWTVITST